MPPEALLPTSWHDDRVGARRHWGAVPSIGGVEKGVLGKGLTRAGDVTGARAADQGITTRAGVTNIDENVRAQRRWRTRDLGILRAAIRVVAVAGHS